MHNEKSINPHSEKDFDELGYESGGWDELQPYNDKQLGRLRAFQHMVKLANDCEAVIENGSMWACYWQSVDESKKPVWIFDANPTFIHIVRMTAFNMYRTEFMKDPGMKLAADLMLHAIKQDKINSREFEIAELNNLWEQP